MCKNVIPAMWTKNKIFKYRTWLVRTLKLLNQCKTSNSKSFNLFMFWSGNLFGRTMYWTFCELLRIYISPVNYFAFSDAAKFKLIRQQRNFILNATVPTPRLLLPAALLMKILIYETRHSVRGWEMNKLKKHWFIKSSGFHWQQQTN